MTYANKTLWAQLNLAQEATRDIERNLVSEIKELNYWPTSFIRAFTWNISESMVMLSQERNLRILPSVPPPAEINSDSVPNQAQPICQRLYNGILGRMDTGVLAYLYRTVESVDYALESNPEILKSSVEVLLGSSGCVEADLLANQLDALRNLKYHAPAPTGGITEGLHIVTNQDVLDKLELMHADIRGILDKLTGWGK